MKLIAITAVKFGPGEGKLVEAGNEFDCDGATGKALLESGGAATPEDYERAKAAAMSDRDRLAALETQNAELAEDNAKLRDELEKAKKK